MSADYATIFHSLPVPFMVLDRDLRFVDANASYCAATLTQRQDLIGRHVFEAFPEEGENLRRYQEAFERALSGEENVIALFPYSVPRPAEQGGGKSLKYWSCTHVPVRDATGRVTHILQQAEDVTALMHKGPQADAALEATVVQRAERLESLSETLRAEGDFLKRLFHSAPGFMAVLSGAAQTIALANEAFRRLVGRSDVVGRPLAEITGHMHAIGASARPLGDSAFIAEAFPLLVRDEQGGAQRRIYVDFVWQPILDDEGAQVAVFIQGSDVTEKVLANQHQQLLLDEINHRVKNTLAVVQALVLQTLRTTPSPADFSAKLQARLGALSATHNLLTETAWSGVDIKALLCQELSHFGEKRITLSGPAALLSPRRTVNLGLVFHEMATNAAKFGALSVPEGRVTVSWRVEPDEEGRPHRLDIVWEEAGGPAVVPPTQSGFGTRLIERTMRAKPDARFSIQYRPEGLVARFNMPAEHGDDT